MSAETKTKVNTPSTVSYGEVSKTAGFQVDFSEKIGGMQVYVTQGSIMAPQEFASFPSSTFDDKQPVWKTSAQ
jgi:hypothetical protein